VIIVTGGAGFIGSNIVKTLNERGYDDIIVVDDLTDGHKFVNIVDCQISDYLDKDDFLQRVQNGSFRTKTIDAVFHEGACSSTTEWDGSYIMKINYEYSKILLHYCLDNKISYLYASSASVYGAGNKFSEGVNNECPINMYGYSKFQFDQYVRKVVKPGNSQVVGFRYFNVYGPREGHKGRMASVASHCYDQIKTSGYCRLFEGNDGYDNGEQRRDFVHVSDAVKVNMWFMDNPQHSGIFNLGTGRSQSFNDVANAVIKEMKEGEIEYIDFPESLKNCYQSFTEADISVLKAVGYSDEFLTVEQGVSQYIQWLKAKEPKK